MIIIYVNYYNNDKTAIKTIRTMMKIITIVEINCRNNNNNNTNNDCKNKKIILIEYSEKISKIIGY